MGSPLVLFRISSGRSMLMPKFSVRWKGTTPVSVPHSPPIWKRFVLVYERNLAKRPIITKSITGGILYGLGDIMGQKLSGQTDKKGFDFPRFFRATIFGGVFYPLPAHLHYNFLESLTLRMGISVGKAPFFKAFMEQFVYWSYLSNAYYHAVLGGLQGMNTTQIYDRVSSTLWDTLKAQWVFWIPVQLINFRYVPVRHQLNFVLVVSLVWTSFLSVAFPPADIEDEEMNSNKNLVQDAQSS